MFLSKLIRFTVEVNTIGGGLHLWLDNCCLFLDVGSVPFQSVTISTSIRSEAKFLYGMGLPFCMVVLMLLRLPQRRGGDCSRLRLWQLHLRKTLI